MKRYEYKLLTDRVTVAMSPKDFGDWVINKLNEWGNQGWQIFTYNTPMQNVRGGGQALTGELYATGCREVGPDTVVDAGEFVADTATVPEGLPVVEGMRAVE